MNFVHYQDLEKLTLVNRSITEMNYDESIKLLADVAVDYVKTKDPRHLLKLPKGYRESFDNSD